MCTATITETNALRQRDDLRETSSYQEITTLTAKPGITMYRGECTASGCNCREYVGANVGTCENCGHHYDSHRY